jgi:hypothetical protein
MTFQIANPLLGHAGIYARTSRSPRFVHSILLEFNYRWNIRMAIKNRGLPDEIGGFYQQYKLDQIREMTSKWSPTPFFPEWPSVRDFEDTLERSGLQRSKLAGESLSIDDIEICWPSITEDEAVFSTRIK